MEKRIHATIEVPPDNNYDIKLTIYNGSKEKSYRFSDRMDAETARVILEDILISEGYEKDGEHNDGHHFVKKS